MGARILSASISLRARQSGVPGCVADEPKDLEITPEELQAHKNLHSGAEAVRLAHYDHYDFSVSLSDVIGGNGWSITSRARMGRGQTTLRTGCGARAGAICCRMSTHSWNGSSAGRGLVDAELHVPMRDDFCGYEGQTQYWGVVLARGRADTGTGARRDGWGGCGIRATRGATGGRWWIDESADGVAAAPVSW